MLSAKGIIGFMISKLGEETQSRWFLCLGEASGREEQKAFSKWLAIEEKGGGNVEAPENGSGMVQGR